MKYAFQFLKPIIYLKIDCSRRRVIRLQLLAFQLYTLTGWILLLNIVQSLLL